MQARADELVASRRASDRAVKETGDIGHRRAAIAPALVTVYRTDADLDRLASETEATGDWEWTGRT